MEVGRVMLFDELMLVKLVLILCRGVAVCSESAQRILDLSWRFAQWLTDWVTAFAFIRNGYRADPIWSFQNFVRWFWFTDASGICIGVAMALWSRRPTQDSGPKSDLVPSRVIEEIVRRSEGWAGKF
jgi:hypothetical protein